MEQNLYKAVIYLDYCLSFFLYVILILLYHKNNTIKWWHKSNGEIFFDERYKGIDLARIEQERDITSRNVELNLWLSEDEDLYSCYEETIYFNKLNEYMTLVQII